MNTNDANANDANAKKDNQHLQDIEEKKGNSAQPEVITLLPFERRQERLITLARAQQAAKQSSADTPVADKPFSHETPTPPSFAARPLCDPSTRSMNDLLSFGIVVIDKPSGPSSHQTASYVKDILHLSRVGHAGTLDPKVTGVLPVGLGKGTRALHALLKAGKEYVCLMQLHGEVGDEQLAAAVSAFTGTITQLPPVRSAVRRRERQRTIYYLALLERSGPFVLFRVGCEAGTYIRKLVHDIGQHIGTGAHMRELRRTKAGPFNETTALCTLQDLKDAFVAWQEEGNEEPLRALIHPAETAVSHLACIVVNDEAIQRVSNGASIAAKHVYAFSSGLREGELVAVLTRNGDLLALARMTLDSSALQPASTATPSARAAQPEHVFAQPRRA
ncbi:RNA-guided pseudouridylation complex pseudouridine synthase subunit Cbf5 [Candidatus Woesearchaeota archaeon]|nr:MAG: RNA-guided pseudouridylation complex pseudouridine synthase subunit Cbf5 [Candidatus Woesearchaeota archaeon]